MMTRAPHIDSYYAATARGWQSAPILTDHLHCDVCVVGGGITGCSSALHLAERGYDVVLLEANRIGWGASGRSGAQVIGGFARDIDYFARLCRALIRSYRSPFVDDRSKIAISASYAIGRGCDSR